MSGACSSHGARISFASRGAGIRGGLIACGLMGLASLLGCAGLGWGQGGAEPTRATAGALVKTFDQATLTRASERLAERVALRWSAGAPLSTADGALAIDWQGWLLMPGAPRLELTAPRAGMQLASSANTDFGLVVHVPVAAASHQIEVSADFLDLPCTIGVMVADGELDVPIGFTADKLGRVQGVVLPGATYHALSDVTPNAILKVDLSSCVGTFDPGAQLAALGSALSDAAVRAVSEALSAEVPSVLGLDLAFGWSAAVNGDALGTGFMRTALRGLATDLIRRTAESVQVAFALTVEADAHPCMAPFSLPAPRADVAAPTLPSGAALHIASLERMVAASWLAGAVCGEHLGVIPIASAPLQVTWPALARLGPDAEVSLELWPAALPRLTADPDMSDGIVLDTGRIRAEIMVTHAGARWRAASVVLDLSVAGTLWVADDGEVTFDPAAVDARPALVEAGLLTAPDANAIAQLLPPLVEALVLGRPLARLPPPLAPLESATVVVSGDYLLWPTR